MKKLGFFLTQNGVSIANGGAINHKFEYEYDTQMPVSELVDLFNKIYEDIQKVVSKHDSTDGFQAIFNYLVHTDDLFMCRFFKGWLEGTKMGDFTITQKGEKPFLQGVIMMERTFHS